MAAVAALPAYSCLIDGEAIVTDEAGLAIFDLLRFRHTDKTAIFAAAAIPIMGQRSVSETVTPLTCRCGALSGAPGRMREMAARWPQA